MPSDVIHLLFTMYLICKQDWTLLRYVEVARFTSKPLLLWNDAKARQVSSLKIYLQHIREVVLGIRHRTHIVFHFHITFSNYKSADKSAHRHGDEGWEHNSQNHHSR